MMAQTIQKLKKGLHIAGRRLGAFRHAQLEKAEKRRKQREPVSEKTVLSLLAVRTLLSLAAVIAGSLPALAGLPQLFCCIFAFLVMGVETFRSIWEHFLKKRYLCHELLSIVAGVGAFSLGAYTGAALMMLFLQLWNTLTASALRDAKSTLFKVLDPRPKTMTLILGGLEHKVASDRIQIGDTLRIPRGHRTAVDCEVLEDGIVELSCVAGEGEATAVKRGQRIYGGARNLGTSLLVRAVKTYDDSMPSLVKKRVETVSSQHIGAEKRVRSIARMVTVLGITLALIIGVLIPMISRIPFDQQLRRGFIILLLSSPAVLTETAPFAVFTGVTGAARRGILLTKARQLQTLSACTTVAADSHGAFSDGKFEIVQVLVSSGEKKALLDLAASAASASPMPILKAVAAAGSCPSDVQKRVDFPGIGACAMLKSGTIITVGHGALMEELGISNAEVKDNDLRLYVAVDRSIAGEIHFRVGKRDEGEALRGQLQNVGVSRLLLLSDQDMQGARQLAHSLHISEFYPDSTPGKKAEKIQQLEAMQLAGERMLYIGDGAGDSVVMQSADLGVILGYHELPEDDFPVISIISGKLSKVCEAIAVGRDTVQCLHRNLFTALGIKAVLLIFAVFGAIPFWLPTLLDGVFLFGTLFSSMRAYDPVRFAPKNLGRAARISNRIFGESAKEWEAQRERQTREDEESRRHRAEVKELLFGSKR